MRLPFEAALIGHGLGTKGYQLQDTHAHSLDKSRDVTIQ